MPAFALHPVPLPDNTPVKIYWLEIDGKQPYVEFQEKMIKSGKKRDLIKFSVLLEEIAQGRSIPAKAHKELRGVPSEDDWREFELRKNQLRLYFFLIPPNDNIIVMGEFKKGKKAQDQTITTFREHKAAFKAAYLGGEIEEE